MIGIKSAQYMNLDTILTTIALKADFSDAGSPMYVVTTNGRGKGYKNRDSAERAYVALVHAMDVALASGLDTAPAI